MPSIPLESNAARIGTALGRPLNQGLDYLVQQKMDKMTRQKERQGLVDLYKGVKYDEATANLLADLSLRDPGNIHKILSTLGAGGYGQEETPQSALQSLQPQQMGMPQTQIAEKVQSPFLKALNKGTQAEKGMSAAQEQHLDTIRTQRESLEDLVTTTDRMLQSLPKTNVGVISHLKSKVAPTWLDETTELFDKDAAHVVNLTSQNIKGVPSKFRVQLIEKEKPGVSHSLKVNEQILKRLNKDAKRSLGSLDKQYPTLKELREPEEKSEGLPPAAEFKGKKARNKKTGQIMQSNGQEWIEVQ